MDSLPIFRKIDAASNADEDTAPLAVPLEESGPVVEPAVAAIAEEPTQTNSDITNIIDLLNDGNDWFIANASEMQRINETTPSHRIEKHGHRQQRRASSDENAPRFTVCIFFSGKIASQSVFHVHFVNFRGH